MTIFSKLTIAGSTITDNFDIKLSNSVSTNNSSSVFEATIDNFDGKNATTHTVGDEVIIYADKDVNPPTTKIFTGILENIKFPSKGLKEKVIYNGRDFSARLMDRTVEPEVYTNLLAGSIVKDIINKYTDDITVTNVDDSTTTISRIAFTQKPVYDAIKELANLAEFTFFVDENKDLNFKLKSETSSGKTFSSGNVISANIKEKRDTVFNEIWVYGDRYLDSFREEFTAGSPLGGSIFTLQNKPHNTSVDVGSPLTQLTRQKGGILGVSIIPPSGTDYLVDFFDKNIVFISGTTIGYDSIPSSGTLVTVDYQRSLPIVKVGQNLSSIETFGKRIKVITDSEIKDPVTAQEILDIELVESPLPKKQGTIKVDGLATITAGQTAVVDLPNQNINNQTYEIIEVRHDFNKENNLIEQVLTLKVNKKINDVTDTIKDLINDVREIRADSLGISDVLTRFQFTTGSFGIRQSGLFVSSRTLGSSFILGKGFHGVTGTTFGGILGSVVASGINFLGDSRSTFIIEFSGGFPTV